MKTKTDRIAHVQANLAENDRNLAAKKITRAQHALIKRDGKRCVAEIRARKD